MFTFPAALVFLLFYVVFSGKIELGIVEPDIWWHLRNAQIMVTTHSFPNFDQFSFTAAGSPWIAHEWGCELLFYAAYRALGLSGIGILFLMLAAAIFLLLYVYCLRSGANPKTSAIVLLLAILIGYISFGPRTLLFGWICMILLMLVLQQWEKTRSRLIWMIPPLFCLWINLHGSWVYGLGVLGLFVAGGLLQGNWGSICAERFQGSELRTLFSVVGASVAALFVNPFGYRLVAFPFELLVFRKNSSLNYIAEWRSANFHDPRDRLFLILIVAFFVSALISNRKWMLRDVLLALFALCTALMYWRMQYFAAIVFVPLIAQRLPLFPPYAREKEKPWLNAAIVLGVVLLISFKFPSEARLNEFVAKQYPGQALNYMVEHNMTARVYNEYRWGGYMIYHTPQIKTFVDGRADIFIYNGTFDDSVKIDQVQDFYEVFDKYRIEYALVPKTGRVSYLLSHSTKWKSVYQDDLAAVYARTQPL